MSLYCLSFFSVTGIWTGIITCSVQFFVEIFFVLKDRSLQRNLQIHLLGICTMSKPYHLVSSFYMFWAGHIQCLLYWRAVPWNFQCLFGWLWSIMWLRQYSIYIKHGFILRDIKADNVVVVCGASPPSYTGDCSLLVEWPMQSAKTFNVASFVLWAKSTFLMIQSLDCKKVIINRFSHA